MITYHVRPGDSLWSIAHTQLGSAHVWPTIYQMNRVTIAEEQARRARSDGLSFDCRRSFRMRGPDYIFPGTILVLPERKGDTMISKEEIARENHAREQAAPKPKPKLKSDFAILDVKAGRAVLLRRLKRGEKVRVVIEGEIETTWSRDDGVSQEFAVNVTAVREV